MKEYKKKKMKANYECIFPEMFMTGIFDEERNNRTICSDAIMAWGNVISGTKTPEYFGKIMSMIAIRLDVIGTHESFFELARKEGWINDSEEIDKKEK